MKKYRNRNNLGKYDAPLIIQYKRGVDDFYRGRVVNPFHKDTMQYREWERGFNKSYFEKLGKVYKYEQKRNSNSTKTISSR